jgi:hypothetical protein
MWLFGRTTCGCLAGQHVAVWQDNMWLFDRTTCGCLAEHVAVWQDNMWLFGRTTCGCLAGQKPNITVAHKSSESLELVKYLGTTLKTLTTLTTLTNKHSKQEDIKSGLKCGNAYCHSVQNLLSPRFYLETEISRFIKS